MGKEEESGRPKTYPRRGLRASGVGTRRDRQPTERSWREAKRNMEKRGDKKRALKERRNGEEGISSGKEEIENT